MSKLKPCPFCGGEAIVLQNDDGFYYVGCKNAECRGYVFYSYVYYFTKERTIEAWNTRKPIDDIVEQLECATGTVCGHKDNENNCGGCAGCTECKMEDAYRYAIEIVKGGAE